MCRCRGWRPYIRLLPDAWWQGKLYQRCMGQLPVNISSWTDQLLFLQDFRRPFFPRPWANESQQWFVWIDCWYRVFESLLFYLKEWLVPLVALDFCNFEENLLSDSSDKSITSDQGCPWGGRNRSKGCPLRGSEQLVEQKLATGQIFQDGSQNP